MVVFITRPPFIYAWLARAIFVRQMIRYIRIALQDDLTIVLTASILDCRTISQNMISKTLVTMDYARKFLAMIFEEQSYRKRPL